MRAYDDSQVQGCILGMIFKCNFYIAFNCTQTHKVRLDAECKSCLFSF